MISRLLRRGVHRYVFEESFSWEEINIMMQSKLKYAELGSVFAREIHFGDNPQIYDNTSNTDSNSLPGSREGYDWSDSSTMIDGSRNGHNVREDDEQEKKDSGVGLDEKDEQDIVTAVANVAANEENIPVVNGHVPAVDGHEQEDENNAAASEHQGPSDTEAGNVEPDDEQYPSSPSTLSDSGYEIAENHPEMIAALLAIVGLGNQIVEGRNARRRGDP
ncbi:hypothetical protein EG329_000735 [Mollisiaceae sp. DMI_Dod_QoI]|nr:hypothetical protein EG329_000735 [Helotiales sp. DMI_Dod_QoI]